MQELSTGFLVVRLWEAASKEAWALLSSMVAALGVTSLWSTCGYTQRMVFRMQSLMPAEDMSGCWQGHRQRKLWFMACPLGEALACGSCSWPQRPKIEQHSSILHLRRLRSQLGPFFAVHGFAIRRQLSVWKSLLYLIGSRAQSEISAWETKGVIVVVVVLLLVIVVVVVAVVVVAVVVAL